MCEQNGGRIAYRANFNATGVNANQAGSPWTERQKLEATLPLMSALDNIPAAAVGAGQTLDVTSVQTSAKYKGLTILGFAKGECYRWSFCSSRSIH